MRLPRARLTVRGLMIAVAVAAIACGAEALRRRRAHLRVTVGECLARERRTRAQVERSQTQLYQLRAHLYELRARGQTDWIERDARAELRSWTAKHEAALRRLRRFEYAARYPWLPVEPDPPEPE